MVRTVEHNKASTFFSLTEKLLELVTNWVHLYIVNKCRGKGMRGLAGGWVFLWCFSVLVGKAVALLGGGGGESGWGEPQVTSVVMAPAGSPGGLTALCSSVCLLATSEAPRLVERCGPPYILGLCPTVSSCWWVSKMAAGSWLPAGPSCSGEAFDVWLCQCVSVLVFSHVKANRVLQYILGGAAVDQWCVLPRAEPPVFEGGGKPLCCTLGNVPSVLAGQMSVPVCAGSWVRGTSLQSRCVSPRAAYEHGSRGTSPVIPAGSLPVWVTSLLLGWGVSMGSSLGILPAWAPASD